MANAGEPRGVLCPWRFIDLMLWLRLPDQDVLVGNAIQVPRQELISLSMAIVTAAFGFNKFWAGPC